MQDMKMNNEAKILIPEKEWIIKSNQEKIGSVSKDHKGVAFLRKGKKIKFQSLSDLEIELGIEIPRKINTKRSKYLEEDNSIYNFPCSSKPYEPVYNIKKKLPLFYKSSKSKSQYCAGFYIIKFKQRWIKSFCPKLITLDRYQYQGPFKTELEVKNLLQKMNKS